MKSYLGIDLGATLFKFGLVSGDKVIRSTDHRVDASYSQEHLLALLKEGINELIDADVAAIGLGVPGIVDPQTGTIYDIQNLPQWKEVALRELLENDFKRPVTINNDANCFALGQYYYGAARSIKNFVGITIGTGLGMGVIIDGKLYNGRLCGAGEIGMLPYLDGILEDYAASFFFSKHCGGTGQELHQRALAGDSEAIKAFNEFGGHIGNALKIVNYTYAPEAIILGGSITAAYPFFKRQMHQQLATFAYPKQIENLKIMLANSFDQAILGAASLCLQQDSN